jgi:hypothetical protein
MLTDTLDKVFDFCQGGKGDPLGELWVGRDVSPSRLEHVGAGLHEFERDGARK